MITVLAKVSAQPGREADLQGELERMVPAVQEHEPGALVYALHTVEGQPGTFYFYEQYEDEAAVQAHRQTAHMERLVSAVRELADGGVEVTRLVYVAGVEQ